MLSITLNGQLLLCQLAERLVDSIDDLTMLQINTDGLTVRIRRSDRHILEDICKEWESLTQLKLEYEDYQQMIIRDVNNYIGQYTDGKCKHKGTFEIDRDIHKNHSRRIVPLALHNHFINGIPVEQTIRNHIAGIKYDNKYDNHGIFDFCIAKKATKAFEFEERRVDHNGDIDIKTLDSKIVRYFVSNRGAVLHEMPAGSRLKKEYDLDDVPELVYGVKGLKGQLAEAHPQKGKSFYTTNFNIYQEAEIYDINYQYYIRECNKIKRVIESEPSFFR